MGKKITTMTDELFEQAKQDLKKIKTEGLVSKRLKAIISSQKNGIKKVCEVLDINRSTISKWMNKYKKMGVKGLLNASKPSRAKLKEEHRMRVKEWIEEKPTSTLKEIVLRCASELDITIEKSSIHRELRKLGFLHITGRKKHYTSDPKAQEKFKKTKKASSRNAERGFLL